MNEDVIRNLFSENIAHKAMLEALIATHPDPEGLLQAFEIAAEAACTGMLNTSIPESALNHLREELDIFRSRLTTQTLHDKGISATRIGVDLKAGFGIN